MEKFKNDYNPNQIEQNAPSQDAVPPQAAVSPPVPSWNWVVPVIMVVLSIYIGANL